MKYLIFKVKFQSGNCAHWLFKSGRQWQSEHALLNAVFFTSSLKCNLTRLPACLSILLPYHSSGNGLQHVGLPRLTACPLAGGKALRWSLKSASDGDESAPILGSCWDIATAARIGLHLSYLRGHRKDDSVGLCLPPNCNTAQQGSQPYLVLSQYLAIAVWEPT